VSEHCDLTFMRGFARAAADAGFDCSKPEIRFTDLEALEPELRIACVA
jgi:uncharacterized protein YdhG (YjbR/CyaY superfamily)